MARTTRQRQPAIGPHERRRRVPHSGDAIPVEPDRSGFRIESPAQLDASPILARDPLKRREAPALYLGNDAVVRVPHVQREHGLRRQRVGRRARRDLDDARGRQGAEVLRDRVRRRDHLRGREERVLARPERRRPRVRVAAHHREREPVVGLCALDGADPLPRFFEDGPLLDVELEVGAEGESRCPVARAAHLPDEAVLLELGLHGRGGVEYVGESPGFLERDFPGPHAGGHHGFGESSPFLAILKFSAWANQPA